VKVKTAERSAPQSAPGSLHFEGNAQGIRLVHTLMRMNLTWAQVGCILKYTRPAWWMGDARVPQLFNEKAGLLFPKRPILNGCVKNFH
jgi:dGTP triphosphohydrolase